MYTPIATRGWWTASLEMMSTFERGENAKRYLCCRGRIPGRRWRGLTCVQTAAPSEPGEQSAPSSRHCHTTAHRMSQRLYNTGSQLKGAFHILNQMCIDIRLDCVMHPHVLTLKYACAFYSIGNCPKCLSVRSLLSWVYTWVLFMCVKSILLHTIETSATLQHSFI